MLQWDIIMCILGLRGVVYPVGLFGIDIGSKGLHNHLTSVFCTAVCFLVNGGQWHEVNIVRLVEFSKVIRYNLHSSIRHDFMRYSKVTVDHTYKFIKDVSGFLLILHQHKSDERLVSVYHH